MKDKDFELIDDDDLIEVEDNTEHFSSKEKSHKGLTVAITVLLIVVVAIISIICYGLFLRSAVKDNDTTEATSIEVQNTVTDTTLTYDIENGICTFTIESSKARAVTVSIYEVLSNDTVQCISIFTIILDETNEFKESKSFVVEKDIKYLIKVMV